MQNLLHRLYRKFEKRKIAGLVAHEQNANDLYLVEHPKSGITWLSVLLANTFLANAGSADRATFSSVRAYIPDLHVASRARSFEFSSPSIRVYKSHATYHPEYVNLIYLVRHPVDVMKSYYRYSCSYESYAGSFDDFCFGSRGAVKAWQRHINSWLVYPHNTNQQFIHLMRYEDLVARTQDEVRALAKNYGWHICDSAIDDAAEKSARSSMVEQEKLYRSRNPAHRSEFISENPINSFNKETLSKIYMTCDPEIRLLGYTKYSDGD